MNISHFGVHHFRSKSIIFRRFFDVISWFFDDFGWFLNVFCIAIRLEKIYTTVVVCPKSNSKSMIFGPFGSNFCRSLSHSLLRWIHMNISHFGVRNFRSNSWFFDAFSIEFHDFSIKYNDFSLFSDAQTNLHEKYSCRVRSFFCLLSVALESSTLRTT